MSLAVSVRIPYIVGIFLEIGRKEIRIDQTYWKRSLRRCHVINRIFQSVQHPEICVFSHSSALNKETGAKVAIKKVPRAFNDAIDAKRILREIKLLKKFKHENVRHTGIANACISDWLINSGHSNRGSYSATPGLDRI